MRLKYIKILVATSVIFFQGILQVQAANKKVSLDEKIGQLMIVGFQGYEINGEVKEYINKYYIGGVILINRGLSKDRVPNIKSPEQLLSLNTELLKLDPSLFISVDQEGGKVARLRAKDGFFKEDNLSHYAIGKLPEAKQNQAMKDIATGLKKYKFNVNFAPVVDIDNKENPIIGKIDRSFGGDISNIYHLAKKYIDVHHEEGLITSIKHFPGHGSSLSDSHQGLTDVTKTWNQNELLPYKELISKDKYNDMVMVGHTFNNNIDKKYPASLSKKVITQMLRKNLNYKGVVITDSLDMGAIVDHYTLKETVVSAINAGVDILLFTNNTPKGYSKNIVQDIHDIIVQAVADKEISEKRIDESYDRIVALKKAYGLIK